MACAFVPARAVVGGKSAAVGAHAPQVLRAPEPDENAAAEGKPPRRHLLDSRHVEDAGRVMDVVTGSHLPTRARASAFGACAAPLRSAPPLSCSAGCSQRRKKPVQKCRWPCALGRGGEAPPRYPASPPSGPTPRRLKQARRCTTRPAGRHTSAVRQPAQSPRKSSRSSSEGMTMGTRDCSRALEAQPLPRQLALALGGGHQRRASQKRTTRYEDHAREQGGALRLAGAEDVGLPALRRGGARSAAEEGPV